MLPHLLIIEEQISEQIDFYKDYGVRVIRKKGPCGYATSINKGLELAKKVGYTHVITVNSDIEFTQPFLVPFVRAFNYGDIVGGTLLYPSGKIQSAGWYYRDDGMPIEYEKGQYLNQAKEYKKERFVGGITGALQGINLECGLYDEGYPLSYEDVDFCVRNILLGRKIFYTPTICAIHFESATRGYTVGPMELHSFKRYDKKIGKISMSALNGRIAEYNETHELERQGKTKER